MRESRDTRYRWEGRERSQAGAECLGGAISAGEHARQPGLCVSQQPTLLAKDGVRGDGSASSVVIVMS